MLLSWIGPIAISLVLVAATALARTAACKNFGKPQLLRHNAHRHVAMYMAIYVATLLVDLFGLFACSMRGANPDAVHVATRWSCLISSNCCTTGARISTELWTWISPLLHHPRYDDSRCRGDLEALHRAPLPRTSDSRQVGKQTSDKNSIANAVAHRSVLRLCPSPTRVSPPACSRGDYASSI